ncbi:MAG: hypothetical protein A2X58_06150 [Nitrospirae bacterium GWC2_56_14]|nr:MAG: hypothetical protein A2X58_06150 [Nitrospirae bacterium GWC2_56_14]
MSEKRYKGLSIFSQLLIAFMVVVVIISGLLTAVYYTFSKRHIEQQTIESLLQQFVMVRYHFNDEIRDELSSDLRMLAANPTLDDFIGAAGPEREIAERSVERLFRESLRYFSSYQNISLLDASGSELITAGRSGRTKPAGSPGRNRVFAELKTAVPGTIRASHPEKDPHGQVFFSIGIDKTSVVAGKIHGSLIIDYRLDEFLEYLDAIKILGDNPLWAFTSDGTVLKQPEHLQAMFDPRPHFRREVAQDRTLLVVEGGLLVYQDFFVTPDAPLLRVAISIPNALLLDDIRSMLRFVFIVFLLLLAVSTVIAYYVSRYFSRPIVLLAHAADRFAHGDLSAKVDTRTTGEMQMLVQNFNRMAADLERTTVSRDYMDNIVSSMMDTLIVASPQGTITRLNEAACFLLGYQEQELIGQPFTLVLGGALGGTDEVIGDVLARGSISNQERWYRGSDGRRIPVLFSASVLRDAQGLVEGVVCVAQDITERKRDESQLKSYSEELALINDDLRNFAYIVSHDLRAPLVNIRGFSDELIYSIRELTPMLMAYLDRFDDEQRRKYLAVIEKDIPEALQFIGTSVSRMDNLITAILKLSRVGRRRLNPEPIQTTVFVQGILNSLAHQIESRRIQVVVEQLPDIITDRTALEQIFGNLLDNAIKYLAPGRQGRIVVGAEHDGKDIVFHICDNGRGMASEDVPKAFDIFRRVGPQDVPGEGMGLAYVKTLLRLLGGRIWCESQAGVGTTFSFSVPAAPSEPEDVKGEADRIQGTSGGAPAGSGTTAPFT